MIVFVTIALVGLVAYLFMSIGGHAADTAHDIVHGDAVHGGDNGHMVSIFSPRVIAIFMMGFGATGALARYSECSYVTSCLYALCVGFVMGGIMWAIAGFFAKAACPLGNTLGLFYYIDFIFVLRYDFNCICA